MEADIEMERFCIDEETDNIYIIKVRTRELNINNADEYNRSFQVFTERHQYDNADEFIVEFCGKLRADCREWFMERLGREGAPLAVCTDTAAIVFDDLYKVVEGDETTIDTNGVVWIELIGMPEDDTWFCSNPASKDVVKELERVTVEEETCVICIDEITSSSSAIKMPCSHVYHEDCMLTWLEDNSSCPLCRFKLPSVATDDAQLQAQD